LRLPNDLFASAGRRLASCLPLLPPRTKAIRHPDIFDESVCLCILGLTRPGPRLSARSSRASLPDRRSGDVPFDQAAGV